MKEEPIYNIIVLHLSNRTKNSTKVQETLTKHGCIIKTRFGVHETDEKYCDENGLIILNVTQEYQELFEELKKIEGLDVEKLTFK